MDSVSVIINSKDRITGSTINNATYSFDWNAILGQGRYKLKWTIYKIDSNSVNPITVSPTSFDDVLDYSFRIKGNSATTPIKDFDGRLTLFNTGNVTMVNDSTRGYVFNFTGFNYLNVNFQNPQIFSRSFWLSSSSANINAGNVFSSKSYPLFFDQNKLLNISFGSETTFVQSATWTHYTVVKNTDTTLLYINGALYQTFNQTYILNTNLLICFGAYVNGNNSNFTGLLDDMRLYPKALTSDEVSRIYGNTNIATPPTPLTPTPNH